MKADIWKVYKSLWRTKTICRAAVRCASAKWKAKTLKPSPLSMAAIRSGVGQGLFMKIVLGALIFIFAAGFLFTGLMSPHGK